LSKQERSQLGWFGSNCLAGSFYGAQLERWQRFFKPEQLLVLRFEDIVLNPLLASQKVALHLGVNPDLLCPKLALAKLNAAPATYLALNPGLAERCRETLLAADCDLWRGLS
ncbi:sulfotransferase, partial [Synechococcus lacustris]